MDLEPTFSAASALVLPGWAILILAPRGRAWLDAIPALAIPVALSGLYAVLILTGLSSATGGGFGSLAEVRARDERDARRDVAPLRPARDAVMIDTSHLGIEEAVAVALGVVRERLGFAPDEMDGGHLPTLTRPRELVERLEAYRLGARGAA